MKKINRSVIACICMIMLMIQSKGQTNKIAKFNSGRLPSGTAESVIFDNGFIGVGTITPGRKFHIDNNVSMDQFYISSSSPSIFLGDNIDIAAASNVGTFALATAADRFATGVAAGDIVMSSKFGKTHFISGVSYNMNGIIRMTLDANGKVGIGTVAPTSSFHIKGMANNGTNASLTLQSAANSVLMDGGTLDANNEFFVNSLSGKNISLCRFSGNVGIGTSESVARTDVFGYPNGLADNPTLKLSSNGNFDVMYFDGKKIETSQAGLQINGISRNSTIIKGKVGIGTNAPVSTLEVVGLQNDGTNAALKIQSMLVDGNEIDATSILKINSNSHSNISLCLNGGMVGVGTGTGTPTSNLQVKGIESDGTDGTLKLVSDDQTLILDGNEIDVATQLHINKNSHQNIVFCEEGGRVGIGTATPDRALNVKGVMKSEELIVSTDWSDFVFDKDYYLKSLQEVEAFINKNGHLPEIPSAEEIEKNGVATGEIESKLLMKIEELTLYAIEQNKKIIKQKDRLTALEAKRTEKK